LEVAACLPRLASQGCHPKADAGHQDRHHHLVDTECGGFEYRFISGVLCFGGDKKNKILVVTEGDGHTRLPLSGKIAEAIVQYLVIGKAPSPGLVLDSLTNTAAPIVVVKLGGIRKTADDYSYMRS
jgi:hypothetical protein